MNPRIFAACLLCLCALNVKATDIQNPTQVPLTMACAANFIQPLKALVTAYEQRHPSIHIQISSASSGKLFTQIVHGAPFDVFLSADQDKPRRLVEKGLGIANSLTTYATGRLLLWAPGQNVQDPVAILAAAKHVALANPKLAPYGMASQQAMVNLGLANNTKSKWVLGENIAQAFQFVYSGPAAVGWIAASQRREDMQAASLWQVPAHLHDPIRQDAVVLTRSPYPQVAQDFINFMRSDDGLAIMARYGYF